MQLQTKGLSNAWQLHASLWHSLMVVTIFVFASAFEIEGALGEDVEEVFTLAWVSGTAKKWNAVKRKGEMSVDRKWRWKRERNDSNCRINLTYI